MNVCAEGSKSATRPPTKENKNKSALQRENGHYFIISLNEALTPPTHPLLKIQEK